MTKGRLYLTVPLFLLLAGGCQKSSNTPATVSGKVTYKGSPVTGGQMTFYSKDAGSLSVAIGADGTYPVTELPVGDVKVTIETESLNAKGKPAQYGGPRAQGKKNTIGPMPEGAAQASQTAYVQIPKKYADPKKSDLTMTLTAGKQTHDFELKD